MVSNFPKRELIKGWLKAGFVFQGKINSTEQGTPQGGVTSPLLANIGLHGLETFIKATNPKLGVVRYADDFIVTAGDKESLHTAQSLIQAWMSSRGLELSTEKTVITSLEDGFDFLGFNSRHYDGKLLIKPSKKKVLAFCKRLGEEIRNHQGVEQEVLIKKLNPIRARFCQLLQRGSEQRNLQLYLISGMAIHAGVGRSVDTPTKTKNGFANVTSEPLKATDGRSLAPQATDEQRLKNSSFTRLHLPPSNAI